MMVRGTAVDMAVELRREFDDTFARADEGSRVSTADFLAVRAALAGEREPSRDLALRDEIRYDR